MYYSTPPERRLFSSPFIVMHSFCQVWVSLYLAELNLQIVCPGERKQNALCPLSLKFPLCLQWDKTELYIGFLLSFLPLRPLEVALLRCLQASFSCHFVLKPKFFSGYYWFILPGEFWKMKTNHTCLFLGVKKECSCNSDGHFQNLIIF